MRLRGFILTTAVSLLAMAGVNAEAQRIPGYVILGGELGNSSASSKDDIRNYFPKLKQMGLNTVLMPVYWELIEPEEGHFDFTLLSEALQAANENDLKIVPLWFGAWKNSMSCYAPSWVKKDTKRYPRAITDEGKPLEILSAFSDNVLNADLKAFNAFIDYLKSNDKNNIVTMIQIENEIGMLESARDHSPIADKEYAKGIPESLAKSLGVSTGASWNTLSTDTDYAEEMFMAWNYARYVEQLAKVAREKLPSTPLYVNAAMDSRGRRPGQYPSAGPLARLASIWKAGAPSVDFLSPDLYDPPFAAWFNQYDMKGNPLFIPEIRRSTDSGTHAFYAFGQHNALGFSPFSIENATPAEAERLKEAYGLLETVVPLSREKECYGLLFDSSNAKESITKEQDGIRTISSHFFTLPWDSRATDGSVWPDGGGIVIRLAKDEYLIAGSGIVVKWETVGESDIEASLGEDGFMQTGSDAAKKHGWQGKGRVGILSCDEVKVNPDGSFTTVRRLNGDETHQGRHVRIGVDGYKALHVKLYRY